MSFCFRVKMIEKKIKIFLIKDIYLVLYIIFFDINIVMKLFEVVGVLLLNFLGSFFVDISFLICIILGVKFVM